MPLRVLPHLVCVLAFAACLAAPPAGAFERVPGPGHWRPWDGLQYENERPLSESFAVVRSPVRHGTGALRFTVRQGYSRWGYGEDTELVRESGEKQGDDYYYAWSTLFPRGWTAPYGWGIFAQWHASLDTGPPVALDARASSVRLEVRAGLTDEARGTFEFDTSFPLLRTLSVGRWNDFVVHVRWSARHDGEIEVWHRLAGEGPFLRRFAMHGIPTLQQTRAGGVASNYTLWGLYRDSYCEQPTQLGCTSDRGVQPTSVIFQDGFSRARTFEAATAAAFGRAASPPAGPRVALRAEQRSRWTALLPRDARDVVDGGCGGCEVRASGAGVEAAVAGGADDADTAYRELRLPRLSPRARVRIHDALTMPRDLRLTGNVAVLQVRSGEGTLLCELYADASRVLRVWSPRGGLLGRPVEETTGFRVADAGEPPLQVDVTVGGGSLAVAVAGAPRVFVRSARARADAVRFVRVGVDHYDGDGAVAVSHAASVDVADPAGA